MRRRRVVLAAVAPFVLLAGCGSGEVTQTSVRDDVRDALLERPDPSYTPEEVPVIAECVSRTMFESGSFSADERNDAARASDGDEPDTELVAKVEDLMDGCIAEARSAPAPTSTSAPSDADADADADADLDPTTSTTAG
jgi:hypothetical protein